MSKEEVKSENLFQIEEFTQEQEKAIVKKESIKEMATKIKEEAEKNSKTEVFVKKRPSLFVNDENVEVEVTVLYSYETGDVLSVFAHTLPIEESLKEIMGIEELVFKFSKMSYSQLRGYRDVCSYIDHNTKELQINSFKMRDCYVYYHLKGWNLKDDEGNDIELKFTDTNSLTEESVKQFYNLSPAIIDIAINEYENKLNI